MMAKGAKGEGTKPTSLSEHKRKVTLARSIDLNERLLDEYKPAFETFCRGFFILHGYWPNPEEDVPLEWPEDVVDDD